MKGGSTRAFCQRGADIRGVLEGPMHVTSLKGALIPIQPVPHGPFSDAGPAPPTHVNSCLAIFEDEGPTRFIECLQAWDGLQWVSQLQAGQMFVPVYLSAGRSERGAVELRHQEEMPSRPCISWPISNPRSEATPVK